jgi:hypothetical protein
LAGCYDSRYQRRLAMRDPNRSGALRAAVRRTVRAQRHDQHEDPRVRRGNCVSRKLR